MMRPVFSRAASRLLRPAASRHFPRGYASVAPDIQKDPVELDKITTLPNGIRVATEELAGHFSGVGVYVDAGSRYENEYLSGVSHIMDRLAFKSTTKRSGDRILESIESLGGNIQCASSRESLMYHAASFNAAVPETVALLAETIRDPRISHDEVHQQLGTADYEISEIWSKPELILPELVHHAAYKDNTLGNPLLCPRERLPFITRSVVEKYRNIFFKPERMVIAFSGVPHEESMRLTEKWFGDMERGEGATLPSIDEEAQPKRFIPTYSVNAPFPLTSNLHPQQPQGLLSKVPLFKSLSTSAPHSAPVQSNPPPFSVPALDLPSVYTGGYMSLPAVPPKNPSMPSFTHIHLGFETPGLSSQDVYALAVLQTVLGGGGSFSAGGPGKGMYSRLYTNVLNQHGWVESCVAFHNSFSDSGLFGISASCLPRYATSMLTVMCHELQKLWVAGRDGLGEEEVRRAKNQLRSNLLMNLESRMVSLEDLGRQVQAHGRKIGVREMCEGIEKIEVPDLRRVATMVFKGKVKNPGNGSGLPTVVVQEGDPNITGFKGGWGEIQEHIARWKLGRTA